MTIKSIPLTDLESGNSAKFTNIGDVHRGRVVDMDERQQTEMDGTPKTFNDGSPRMQWVITIQPDDGDPVQLYAKGGNYKVAEGSGESMLTAIGLAVRAAGAEALEADGDLAVAYTGNGEITTKGGKPKLYSASYKPPVPPSIPASDLFGES